MKIHEKVRRQRRKLDMTQAEMSEKTGISIGTINIFENGKGNIGSEFLEKIFEVLDIQVVV